MFPLQYLCQAWCGTARSGSSIATLALKRKESNIARLRAVWINNVELLLLVTLEDKSSKRSMQKLPVSKFLSDSCDISVFEK